MTINNIDFALPKFGGLRVMGFGTLRAVRVEGFGRGCFGFRALGVEDLRFWAGVFTLWIILGNL